MGRSPCCAKIGLKKGPWIPEEDRKLLAYIEEHGHGSWRELPEKAGLQRCGKSCRLRWTNYLRPDIKRGKFSSEEEQTIIKLHAHLGNRWSAIATHLAKRTDNEIKNYWNTHLKKRLTKMGIDPATHKPKNQALCSADGQSKNAASLSHLTQWENARLEAEARLVRESKPRSRTSFQRLLGSSSSAHLLNKLAVPSVQPLCVDVLKSLQGIQSKSTNCSGSGGGIDLESPTSTLSSSENIVNAPPVTNIGLNEEADEDWSGHGNPTSQSMDFTEKKESASMNFTTNPHSTVFEINDGWTLESAKTTNGQMLVSKFVEECSDLLSDNTDDRNSSNVYGTDCDFSEENKNYWNNILNLVISSPSDSPVL